MQNSIKNVILLRFKDANKSINNRTKSILIYIKVANPDISLEENENDKRKIFVSFLEGKVQNTKYRF